MGHLVAWLVLSVGIWVRFLEYSQALIDRLFCFCSLTVEWFTKSSHFQSTILHSIFPKLAWDALHVLAPPSLHQSRPLLSRRWRSLMHGATTPEWIGIGNSLLLPVTLLRVYWLESQHVAIHTCLNWCGCTPITQFIFMQVVFLDDFVQYKIQFQLHEFWVLHRSVQIEVFYVHA